MAGRTVCGLWACAPVLALDGLGASVGLEGLEGLLVLVDLVVLAVLAVLLARLPVAAFGGR